MPDRHRRALMTTAIAAPTVAGAPHSDRHREPGPLGRLGHPDRHQAQPARHHPHPRGAVLLDRAADHVRAAVPLRLRRRHQRPRGQLRELPDARDLRADGGLRRGADQHRPGRGPAEGPHRAVPGPAHGPLGRARRPHHGRPGAATSSPWSSSPPSGFLVGFRPTTGVLPYLAGILAHPAVRLRPVVGVRGHRAVRPQQRDGPGHVLPHPLPADLRLLGLRPGRRPCPAGCRASPPTNR